MDHDVFISHASEDKDAVARPLARHLEALGLKVWLDEGELTLGDSLRRSLEAGLARSRYGVVVLSPAFFAKEWTNKELDALVAREDGSGKVVLPVWHHVTAGDVARHAPLLAGKLAVSTSRGIPAVAAAVQAALQGAAGAPADPGTVRAAQESAALEQLRRDMLTAASSRELKRTAYAVEGHLERYPHSVEARELQDQLEVALLSAQRFERAPAASAPQAAPKGAGAAVAIAVVVFALVAYAVLRFLGRV